MTFILDTNVFIEAWNKYYSPSVCQDYWQVIETLAQKGVVRIPEQVYDELEDKDDDLFNWIKARPVLIETVTEGVQQKMSTLLADNVAKNIVNNNRRRNLADPWVIAHAMENGHTVVTKEILTGRDHDPRIPDVCAKFNVPYLDDFQFIQQVGMKFTVTI